MRMHFMRETERSSVQRKEIFSSHTTKLNVEFYIMAKELQVYVNDELLIFNVSEAEFLAATTGNEEVIKLLVERERERRSMAMMEELELHPVSRLEANKPVDVSEIYNEQLVDASEINNEAKKESFIWPDKAVLLLLDIYRNKELEFAGLKRHNKIWNEISNEMKEANYNVTGTQCQNKMSGLKRTYKNITDSNKKSGNHSSSWAFYSAMDSIFGEKAWIDPVSIASSDNPPSPGSSNSLQKSSSTMEANELKPKKRRVESMLESFIIEIKEDKQKEREDRRRHRAEKVERQNQMHKERMQLQQSLLEIFTKITERK